MIKVLVLDDHQLLLQAISNFLKIEENIKIVGAVSRYLDVLKFLESNEVDIILSDISLSDEFSGMDLLKKCSTDYPKLKIIFLTMHNEIRYIREAFNLGVSGYILKKRGIEEVVLAINSVYEGSDYFGDEVAQTYMRSMRQQEESMDSKLTMRQLEILKFMSKGYDTSDISNELDIAKSTVEVHKRKMIETLKLRGAKDLLKYSIQKFNN